MKTFRTALLAAAVTAGLPALAYAQDAPQDRGGQPHARSDREARPDQGQRPDRDTPPAPQAQPQPQPQAIRNQDVQRQAAPDRNNGEARPYGRFAPGQQPGGNQDFRNRGNFDDRRAPPPPPQASRPDRPDGFTPGYPNRPGYDYGRPRGWSQPGGDWRGREWRQDRRYDWRSYRDYHRDLFRGPRYFAPRGWYGYRRFSIGFQLPAFLFGQEYWIADPWAYRLPPADGPYRWVRYYNDVLLIDLRNGAVIDEIPDFFW